MTRSLISVPGKLQADYDHETGRILAWHFTPAAGYAGYFGPEALTDEGPVLEDFEPFFQAVTNSLHPGTLTDILDDGDFIVTWQTDGPDIRPFLPETTGQTTQDKVQ